LKVRGTSDTLEALKGITSSISNTPMSQPGQSGCKVEIVEKFTQPLFVVFNFFEISRKLLEEIVNKYALGEVT